MVSFTPSIRAGLSVLFSQVRIARELERERGPMTRASNTGNGQKPSFYSPCQKTTFSHYLVENCAYLFAHRQAAKRHFRWAARALLSSSAYQHHDRLIGDWFVGIYQGEYICRCTYIYRYIELQQHVDTLIKTAVLYINNTVDHFALNFYQILFTLFCVCFSEHGGRSCLQ